MRKKNSWKNLFQNNTICNKVVLHYLCTVAKCKAERDKIQSLDMNTVNMTAESLHFWWTKFVEGVCKEDGEQNAEFTVFGQFCMFVTFCYSYCTEDG